VITRTSGLQLGVISHFLVHPRTAAVTFLALREKGLGGMDTGGIVPLTALFQARGSCRAAAPSPHRQNLWKPACRLCLTGRCWLQAVPVAALCTAVKDLACEVVTVIAACKQCPLQLHLRLWKD
jgi:hypothetical protein